MLIKHHSVRHQQQLAVEAAANPQDVAFFDAQLLRTVSLALSAVGFDSVKPTALEAFRAEVEQYMLRFLAYVTSSMNSNRRTQPIPQDFISALAHLGVTPADLLPHIKRQQLPAVTQPPLQPAPPDDPPSPRIEDLLGSNLGGVAPVRMKYIPQHLPQIPSRHTWQGTPIYLDRESDARRIRELATEEGVLAEQAMRKLVASGVQAKSLTRVQRSAKDQMIWDDAMKSLLQMDEEQKRRDDAAAAMDWEGEGHQNGADGVIISAATDQDATILVNYEEKYWRPVPQRRKH